jgi:hypothetical protein
MFEIGDLTADTLYEFRVCFANETGRSEYSIPSQRYAPFLDFELFHLMRLNEI